MRATPQILPDPAIRGSERTPRSKAARLLLLLFPASPKVPIGMPPQPARRKRKGRKEFSGLRQKVILMPAKRHPRHVQGVEILRSTPACAAAASGSKSHSPNRRRTDRKPARNSLTQWDPCGSPLTSTLQETRARSPAIAQSGGSPQDPAES